MVTDNIQHIQMAIRCQMDSMQIVLATARDEVYDLAEVSRASKAWHGFGMNFNHMDAASPLYSEFSSTHAMQPCSHDTFVFMS